MRLYICRHGLAEAQGFGGDDTARPLSAAGERMLQAVAPRYAGWIGRAPDRVISSPYARALRTAEILAEVLGRTVEVDPAVTPGGDPERVRERLHDMRAAGAERVVLVSHEPLVGRLLGLLVFGQPRSLPFDPGMLAGVHLPASSTTVGRLELLIRQEDAV